MFDFLEPTTLTAAGLAVLIVELIKIIYKKVTKQPDYVFSLGFYTVLLPVLNILSEPLLFYLGMPGSILPTNWILFGQTAAQALVGSLLSLVLYNSGLKPFKEYGYRLRELKDSLVDKLDGEN